MTQANVACCTGGATATIALLCCLSVGPVVAFLSAIGLGFLLSDAILIPLLIAGLGVALWGLRLGTRIHQQQAPTVVAAFGGVAAAAGVFVWAPLAYAGIAAVLAAVTWSTVALRRASRTAEAGEPGTGARRVAS